MFIIKNINKDNLALNISHSQTRHFGIQSKNSYNYRNIQRWRKRYLSMILIPITFKYIYFNADASLYNNIENNYLFNTMTWDYTSIKNVYRYDQSCRNISSTVLILLLINFQIFYSFIKILLEIWISKLNHSDKLRLVTAESKYLACLERNCFDLKG